MRAVKRAKSYHHGDLRAAMVDAVAEVIRERGLSQVSLRGVARRVGVTHAAATHHFQNKAGLLTAFATQGYLELARSVLASISVVEAPDGPAMLEAVGRGYVRFALAAPERFEAMFRLDLLNPDDASFAAASEAAYSLLTSTIERCRDEGFLADGKVELTAVSAWSLVHGLSGLWISGRLSERIAEQDPERLAAEVSRLFVDSVLRLRPRR